VSGQVGPDEVAGIMVAAIGCERGGVLLGFFPEVTPRAMPAPARTTTTATAAITHVRFIPVRLA
jgi:hypothetical protein